MMLTDRFNEALVYACNLHREQVRKADGTPYVAHLLAVAALVLEDQGSETEAIAALLHDALEDQGGEQTRQEILQRFGPDVTAIVEGCSETITPPKPPWRERKQQYLEHLRHCSPAVLRVSLADKLHNGRSLLLQLQAQGPQVWDCFHQPNTEILWFYESLGVIYGERWASPFVAEFTRVVARLRLEVTLSRGEYPKETALESDHNPTQSTS